MDKVRFGIIGLGNQGGYYALQLFDAGKIENGVMTAGCDINPAKIEHIKRMQIIERYNTLTITRKCSIAVFATRLSLQRRTIYILRSVSTHSKKACT